MGFWGLVEVLVFLCHATEGKALYFTYQVNDHEGISVGAPVIFHLLQAVYSSKDWMC
jgi:hypothetical protein